jgi:hypothetical protein
MEPTTDHERRIAQTVDQKLLEGVANNNLIRDVAVSLDFVMTPSDGRFLVSYVRWRFTHTVSSAHSA